MEACITIELDEREDARDNLLFEFGNQHMTIPS